MIEEIKDIETVSCGTMFIVFMRYLHPFFSVIFAFDIELKRLIRHMLLMIKLAALVIVGTLIFGDNYRVNENMPSR